MKYLIIILLLSACAVSDYNKGMRKLGVDSRKTTIKNCQYREWISESGEVVHIEHKRNCKNHGN